MKHYSARKLLSIVVLCFYALVTKAQPKQQPTLILPAGHSGGVYEAIFSPNYKFILTRDRFEIPRVWDTKTGYLLANLKGHNGRVYRMGYTSDGKKFFTGGSDDSTIIIWDTKTATKLFTLKTKGKTVQGGCFNFKGDKFVGVAQDVRIWDMKTGKLLLTLDPRKKDDKSWFETREARFNKEGNIVMATYQEDSSHRYYWNAQTGKLLAKTKYDPNTEEYILSEAYTTDTSFLNVNSKNWHYPLLFPEQDKGLVYDLDSNTIAVTDSAKKITQYFIAPHSDFMKLFYFLPNGDLVAEPINKLYAGVWDINTMQMKKTIYYKGGFVRSDPHSGKESGNIILNNDRSKVIQLVEKNFKVYDMNSQKQLMQFKQADFTYKLKNGFFSNGDSMILTVMYEGKEPATLWETSTGKVIKSFAFDDSDYISHACFSNDNKWVALFGINSIIKIYDIESGQLIKTLKREVNKKYTHIFGGAISPDNRMIFFIDNEALFKLYDINSGKVLYELNREPGNYISAAAFTPDSKKMVLSTSACINKVIDIASHKMLYRFIHVDSTDYFTQTPDGYYQATPGATKLLHYVTKDLKIITFDQLDIKYNRPDKVLESIGSKDAALIQSYHKAWEKRIRKLGIDTTQFSDGYSVPEFDFINRDAIEYNQTRGKLSLNIKGADDEYKLDRFNIWVNEVPLFGLKGISIKQKHKNNFDTAITVTLSQGENRIETSVINANGTESYRMPLFAKYAPAISQKTKKHFIGFGINQFANPDYNLNWSVKDIRDLALKLHSKYPEIIIDTLFDKNLTKENILSLKKKLQQLNEDDVVMISYSGHGILSSDFDYYLSTYSINFNSPEGKGLAYDELESLFDNIKPRQKLMLIDACHSGEVDKDEIAKIEASKKSFDNAGIAHKSTIKVVPKKNIGMANSFELMQSLFVNVGKGTGATIISAAGGMQYAQERGDLRNGVFTYSIIEAFNNNLKLKVSELKRIVSNRVLQLTNGLQKPTSRNETNNYDWIIW
jgi:WD40 repeat protein